MTDSQAACPLVDSQPYRELLGAVLALTEELLIESGFTREQLDTIAKGANQPDISALDFDEVLGVDSMFRIQLYERIQGTLQLSIGEEHFFGAQSVEGLAQLILNPPALVPKRKSALMRLLGRGEARSAHSLPPEPIVSPSQPLGSGSPFATPYSTFIYLVLGTVMSFTWLAVVLLPGVSLRRRAVQSGARALIRLTGVPYHTEGLERLPNSGQYILVSNHASYIDTVLLSASLPPRFGFVAKMELGNLLPARIFFNGIRAQFVNRFDIREATKGLSQMVERLQHGDNLCFFAEGTIYESEGIRPFKSGAFLLAAKSGCPIVPIALCGTREFLRAEQWTARPAKLALKVGEPLWVDSGDPSSVDRLKELTRAAIAQMTEEPIVDSRGEFASRPE